MCNVSPSPVDEKFSVNAPVGNCQPIDAEIVAGGRVPDDDL